MLIILNVTNYYNTKKDWGTAPILFLVCYFFNLIVFEQHANTNSNPANNKSIVFGSGISICDTPEDNSPDASHRTLDVFQTKLVLPAT